MFVESQTLEFKQLWKDDYLKTICAFANGKGGQLFIGVNDEGEITGINNCKQLLETLPNKINNKLGLLVHVIPHTKDHKEYIEINVLGTLNIIDYCTQAGLPKPEFAYSWGAVRTTFYKKAVAADQVTPQVAGQVTEEMIKLVKSINGEATRMELMQQMGLSSRANFAKLYLVPALEAGLIEMTIPDKPNSRLQKYKLTELGKAVVEKRNNE